MIASFVKISFSQHCVGLLGWVAVFISAPAAAAVSNNLADAPVEYGRSGNIQKFEFKDFSDVSSLKLNKETRQIGEFLRLSLSRDFNAGSVFSLLPVPLDVDVSFSTKFKFKISNNGGNQDEDGTGADGIVFVVQTVSNTAGSDGGGIGYANIGRSAGVEFDTWKNDEYGDADGNHVGIDIGGSVWSIVKRYYPVKFNNGADWYAWVDYNGFCQSLEARVSMVNARPKDPYVVATVDLVRELQVSEAYVGFTSATGSAYSDHDILSWSFINDYMPIDSEASSGAGSVTDGSDNAVGNFIFRPSYSTLDWHGDLRRFKRGTEIVASTIADWSAADQLNKLVTSGLDKRKLWVGSSRGLVRLIDSDLSKFNINCSNRWVSQCDTLSAAEKINLMNANLFVDWYRGSRAYEIDQGGVFRSRQYLLGDIVAASPVLIGPPNANLDPNLYPTYTQFKTAQKNRPSVVIAAANDGMVHAFDVATGNEVWAYVPSPILANLYQLADAKYNRNHKYFINATPTLADVLINGEWKSVLIGGFGHGAKAYYALDVTNPLAPRLLWEKTEAALPGLQYTYHKPVIAEIGDTRRWNVILTSGYGENQAKGIVYLLDLETENFKSYALGTDDVSEIGTFQPQVTSASVDALYLGDQAGSVWRIDLSNITATAAEKIAQLSDDSGSPQPISGAILASLQSDKRLLLIGTGRYLSTRDLKNKIVNSIYVLEDPRTRSPTPMLPLDRRNFLRKTFSIISLATGQQRRDLGGTAMDWSRYNGWYVDLTDKTNSGIIERYIGGGIIDSTLGIMPTIVPTEAECPNRKGTDADGARSWMNYFDLLNAQPVEVSNVIEGMAGDMLTRGSSWSTVGVFVPSLQKLGVSSGAGSQCAAGEILATFRDGSVKCIPSAPSSVGGRKRMLWRTWQP